MIHFDSLKTMHRNRPCGALSGVFFLAFAGALCLRVGAAPEFDSSGVIRGIDGSVAHRDNKLLGYTVTERYTVFRNGEKTIPAAEMTVKTTYAQDVGKSYQIESESGSELLRKEILARVLEDEKTMNEPANRSQELITSANYGMTVQGREAADGRDCYVVAIEPKRAAPYLFKGKIWVDVESEDIVRLEGVASKSTSMVTGPARVVRKYAEIAGFPMATHASAAVSSWLLGPTRIEIEYTGYTMRQHPAE